MRTWRKLVFSSDFLPMPNKPLTLFCEWRICLKKIPTLFEYEIVNKKVVGITDKVRPGFEWVLEGRGTATVQWDGVCCAIIDGRL